MILVPFSARSRIPVAVPPSPQQGQVPARRQRQALDPDLGGESYRESRSFRPGESAVAADLPIVQHAAKLFDRAVQEHLFFGG